MPIVVLALGITSITCCLAARSLSLCIRQFNSPHLLFLVTSKLLVSMTMLVSMILCNLNYKLVHEATVV